MSSPRSTSSGADTAAGCVYLVGAGPGDPELLTVRAVRLLQQADVVLHDALIDPRVLAIASKARLIDVGKRAGKPATSQRFIDRLLVTSARHYRCVVRLKGGDPSIYGRLDEEMRALRDGNINFEVVPGVTAACAAAASLQVSLTLRGVARGVRFFTPRTAPHGRSETLIPVADATGSDTLVVYMAGQLMAEVAQRLMQAGRPASTPLVAVEDASLPTERRWWGTLGSASAWSASRSDAAVLLLIGDALSGAQFDDGQLIVEGRKFAEAVAA